MLWIYLIILFFIFSGGLIYLLRYVLMRNINKATGRLHELSKDYTTKEGEAKQLVQKAQQEAKSWWQLRFSDDNSVQNARSDDRRSMFSGQTTK